MKGIREALKDADPLDVESALASDEARAVRRAVVAAAGERAAEPAWWPGPLVVATLVAGCLVAGLGIGRFLPPSEEDRPAIAPTVVAQPVGSELDRRRQIEFTAPGGTRIVWVLNSDFAL